MTRFCAIAGMLVLGLILMIHQGCASREVKPTNPRIVRLEEFSASTQTPPTVPSSKPDNPELFSNEQMPTATAPAQQQSGSTSAELKPGAVVIVDRVIGQVSGRPIFADTILEPIADQLRQEAAHRTMQEFGPVAAQIVNDRLNEVILTELFIAEAEAALTEEQQKGLLALMRDFKERKLAEKRGSRSLLEKELGLEGMTPEQLVELEKNRMLIMNLINEKISPRVIVSWRDVEREYERRKGEFMPRGKVTFRRIRLSTSDSAAIAQVSSRLEAGDAFADVATDVGMSDGGLWETFTMNSDDVSDIEIVDVYKPFLKGLAQGQTTAPIEREGRTQWLHVDRIDRGGGKTLYDVQRQLTNELYMRRNAEERKRYIDSLFSKGIYSELEEMSRRVLAVALMRYGRGSGAG